MLNNCGDDPRELAEIIAGRTRSQVVQVIGKNRFIREGKDIKRSSCHYENRSHGRTLIRFASDTCFSQSLVGEDFGLDESGFPTKSPTRKRTKVKSSAHRIK